MKRIIVYGSEKEYLEYRDVLQMRQQRGDTFAAGLCTGLPSTGTVPDALTPIPPERLAGMEFDYLLILPEDEKETILKLTGLGIERQRIINKTTFEQAEASWEEMEAVRNGRITILSNNCFGGLLAKTLCMECCSPTRGLWIAEHLFPRFLAHLDDYLSEKPVFAGWEYGSHDYESSRFPVLALGDLALHCNHDTDADEAIEKWVKGVKKINPNNMIAVFVTEIQSMEPEFYRIERIRWKVCFASFPGTDPRTVTVQKRPDMSWLESALMLARPGTPLDVIGMLSGRAPAFLPGRTP